VSRPGLAGFSETVGTVVKGFTTLMRVLSSPQPSSLKTANGLDALDFPIFQLSAFPLP